MICKDCGTVQTRRSLPGSGWIELILWLFWLLPGVIYSIWRRTGAGACTACGSRRLVSESTPVGEQLLKQHHPGGTPAPLPPAPPARPNMLVHRATQVLLAALGLLLVASFLLTLLALRR